ncbi:MAG: hypothetical protein R3Y35_00020 [Clostridia bacterium]
MPTDIGHMREDAIRRSKEMYARATKKVQTPPLAIISEKSVEDEEMQKENFEVNNNIINEFLKDKDKMLVISLLVILSQEECDNTILFALMFLLI